MKNNKNEKIKKTILYLILGGFLAKLFRFLFRRNKKKLENIEDNFKDFVEEEKKEVEELKCGKESFLKYCHDSHKIFCDYFIPNEDNDNRPKILRPKSLVIITILLLFLKASVTGYLFFIYPNAGKMQQDITREILTLINQDRNSNDLVSLSINPVLSASALAKADDMIINNYFAHYSPAGKKPWDWIDRGQYAYLYVGENLAMNFSSAKSAHKALMDSPSHKKNILNSRYNDVGIAMVTGEIDGKTTNVLVELFATRSQASLATSQENSIVVANVSNTVVKTENETEVLATEGVLENTIQQEVTSASKEQQKIDSSDQQKSSSEIKVDLENKTAFTSISEEQKESPEKIQKIVELDPEDNLNHEISFVASADEKKIGVAATLVKTSKYIYLAFLVLMILSLALAVFIRITIQHKPVIAQTLLVILLIIGLLSVKVHILETISNSIAIL